MNTDNLFVDRDNLPKPLPKKESRELFEKMNQGDSSARDKLIKHNIRLVIHQVSKKFNYGYEQKELVAIGNIGLIKAVDTFDVSKKTEFATYAIKCINNEILMFIRQQQRKMVYEESLNAPVCGQDDESVEIQDTLYSDVDVEEECGNKEIYQVIREIVAELSGREKEMIMLYFGFYNGRAYSQGEIAQMLSISRSYTSRLINGTIAKLRLRLKEKGFIDQESHSNLFAKLDESEQKEKTMGRRLQTLYEYFSDCTREEVDLMLTKLTDEERNIITLRYGEDLDNPKTSEKFDKKASRKYYGGLRQKMTRLLKKSSNERVRINDQTEELKNTLTEAANGKPTKEEYLKILQFLKTPGFLETLATCSPKEAIIASLQLGYIDNKFFSSSEIAELLGIEEQEVSSTTKDVLLAYKLRTNKTIDEMIEANKAEASTTTVKTYCKQKFNN